MLLRYVQCTVDSALLDTDGTVLAQSCAIMLNGDSNCMTGYRTAAGRKSDSGMDGSGTPHKDQSIQFLELICVLI
jgi:hypothetical protein